MILILWTLLDGFFKLIL